jgi:hypothetical protein
MQEVGCKLSRGLIMPRPICGPVEIGLVACSVQHRESGISSAYETPVRDSHSICHSDYRLSKIPVEGSTRLQRYCTPRAASTQGVPVRVLNISAVNRIR